MTYWDKRYQQGEHVHDEPHVLVVTHTSKMIPGRALDVASGTGRHAIWLAERGWQVTAVDNSRVGGVVIAVISMVDDAPPEFTFKSDSSALSNLFGERKRRNALQHLHKHRCDGRAFDRDRQSRSCTTGITLL